MARLRSTSVRAALCARSRPRFQRKLLLQDLGDLLEPAACVLELVERDGARSSLDGALTIVELCLHDLPNLSRRELGLLLQRTLRRTCLSVSCDERRLATARLI